MTKRNRIPKICAACGNTFEVTPANARRRKTCSRICDSRLRSERWKGNNLRAGLKPANSFTPGHATWNAGLKGTHFSPATEFKKGRASESKAPIGTVRIRTFTRSKDQRAFIKVAEPNIWRLRAHVVWEEANGPIPRGMLVHHDDRDKLNDDITNLRLETRASHMLEHRPEFEEKRRAALRSGRKENCPPASALHPSGRTPD